MLSKDVCCLGDFLPIIGLFDLSLVENYINLFIYFHRSKEIAQCAVLEENNIHKRPV